MEDFATQLRDKPVLVEHDSDGTGPVGTIRHAWKSDDAKLHVLFETDDTTFRGTLASRLVRHGLTPELSLGHKCKINFSADDVTVGEKTPVEVSLVFKGDRPDTAIRGWAVKQDPGGKSETTEYICEAADGRPETKTPTTTMAATEAEATPTPTETETPQAEGTTEMHALLEELRKQTETNAALKTQQEESAAQMATLNERVGKYQMAGTKRRQEALDGAVKDWVAKMVQTHKQELGPYEGQLQEVLSAMKNHDDADPLVQMLTCAASASAASTSKLNKAYQELKDAQQSAKRLKTQYAEAQKPAMSSETARFEPPKAPAAPTPAPSDAYSRLFAAGSTSSARRGGGLAAANPDMWRAIQSRARAMPTGSAMRPAFDTNMFSDETRKRFRA